MKIIIASDHRGFIIKERIFLQLSSEHSVSNAGPFSENSVDYPDFAAIVAHEISQGYADRGILVCGTGIGMAITANKFPSVRAASCMNELSAKLSRQHNDLNVLCIGADLLGFDAIDKIVNIWLQTDFDGDRHERRINKIHSYDR
tara:strand:- start:15837 stop:16271 length:435 start_codon:yes stop_codon:yes gene_type:complete